MQAIGVIPARWKSTRFEGKVLALIHGKPMIQHVFERAQESKNLDEVIIACDDERVKTAAENFGAKAVMTSEDHPSGSDRIAEAVEGLNVDVVVNIQGDEPLIDPKLIDDLVDAFLKDQQVRIVTAVKAIDQLEDLENPNVVKVVIDDQENALYFSRSKIPFNRDEQDVEYLKHLGIYAYRKEFLFKFKDLPRSRLENIEKLEQLRILESGYAIKTVRTTSETVGVDTPEDLERVQKLF